MRKIVEANLSLEAMFCIVVMMIETKFARYSGLPASDHCIHYLLFVQVTHALTTYRSSSTLSWRELLTHACMYDD
jgi:hypothetical protein